MITRLYYYPSKTVFEGCELRLNSPNNFIIMRPCFSLLVTAYFQIELGLRNPGYFDFVLMWGPNNAGKSAILGTLVHGTFFSTYSTTKCNPETVEHEEGICLSQILEVETKCFNRYDKFHVETYIGGSFRTKC